MAGLNEYVLGGLNAAAASGTLPVSGGGRNTTCYILHKDGTATDYNASANTDVARGTGLVNAVAAAVANDLIICSGGTFDLGSSVLVLPASVTLRGAGKKITKITSAVPNAKSLLQPGDNSITEDLWLDISGTAGATPQVAWGGNNDVSGSMTNAILRRCNITSIAHGVQIEFAGTGTCSAYVSDVDIQAYELGVWLHDGAGDGSDFIDCKNVNVTITDRISPSHTANGFKNNNSGTAGMTLTNCTANVTNTDASGTQCCAVNSDTGILTTIYGGSFTTTATAANNLDLRNNSSTLKLNGSVNFASSTGALTRLQGSFGRLVYAQTNSVTVTASVVNTTETTLIGTGQGSVSLPANFFATGKVLHIKLGGRYTTSGAPPTLDIKMKLTGTGGATICDTGVMNLVTEGLASLTNARFEADYTITCRSSSTVFGEGNVRLGLPSSFINVDNPCINTAATSVTITNAQPVAVTATWGSNTAGNSVTVDTLQIIEYP